MKRDQRYDVVIVGAAAAKAVILHGGDCWYPSPWYIAERGKIPAVPRYI